MRPDTTDGESLEETKMVDEIVQTNVEPDEFSKNLDHKLSKILSDKKVDQIIDQLYFLE